MILPGQDGRRFVVAAVTGYSEGRHMTPATSYTVLDAECAYREVACYWSHRGGRNSATYRLRRALARADELEQTYATAKESRQT